jgi:hypothetical protein
MIRESSAKLAAYVFLAETSQTSSRPLNQGVRAWANAVVRAELRIRKNGAQMSPGCTFSQALLRHPPVAACGADRSMIVPEGLSPRQFCPMLLGGSLLPPYELLHGRHSIQTDTDAKKWGWAMSEGSRSRSRSPDQPLELHARRVVESHAQANLRASGQRGILVVGELLDYFQVDCIFPRAVFNFLH